MAVFYINCKVSVKSGKSELIRLREKYFKVKLKTAAEKGRANKELLSLLADYFSVKPASVTIVAGWSSPVKLIKIETGR